MWCVNQSDVIFSVFEVAANRLEFAELAFNSQFLQVSSWDPFKTVMGFYCLPFPII